MSMRRSLAALLFAAVLAPSAAYGQQPPVSDAAKGTARDLAVEGYALLDKQDFAGAADRFKRADTLFHAPTISLGLARAYVGLGKLLAAREAYSRTAHETLADNAPPQFATAVAEAQRELNALAPRVPGVVIQVKGPTEPKVTIDGAEVPAAALGVKWPVDPGQHAVKASAAGFAPREATFSVAEGKVESVTMELKPSGAGPVVQPPAGQPSLGAQSPPGDQPSSSSGSTRRTLGFVGLAAGGAGLALGAIMGGLVIAKHGDLAPQCQGGHCKPSLQPQLDTYSMYGAVSTAGFIAGGVLAATGIVLVVTAPKAPPAVGVTVVPVLGPTWAGLEGRFQ
jgi:hypothetical protein